MKKIENRFYIINDADKPSKDLLVYKDADGTGIYLFDRKHREQVFPKQQMAKATPVENFGIDIFAKDDGTLHFMKEKPSIAQYDNGKPRDWQDAPNFTVTLQEIVTGINKGTDPY